MNRPLESELDDDAIQRVVRQIENARGPGYLMKIRIAASLAELHPDTVRRWIREGRVKAWGTRGTLRVCLDDLLPPRDQKGS